MFIMLSWFIIITGEYIHMSDHAYTNLRRHAVQNKAGLAESALQQSYQFTKINKNKNFTNPLPERFPTCNR